MEFSAYVASLGLDIATITAEQKVNLQAAWRATDRAQQLQTLRESRSAIPFPYAKGGDSEPQARSLIEAGLLSHIGIRGQHIAAHYGERVADAVTRREHRCSGIQHVMRQFLRANGHHAPEGKFSDGDIANVFRLDRSIPIEPMSVGPSTGIQLSGILSNVANKSLLFGFEDTPVSWRQWCKTGSVDDFKSATRYRLAGARRHVRGTGRGVAAGVRGEDPHPADGRRTVPRPVERVAQAPARSLRFLPTRRLACLRVNPLRRAVMFANAISCRPNAWPGATPL